MLPHLTQTAPAQSVYRPSEPRLVPFQGAPVFQKLKAGPKPPLFAGSPPEKQSIWQTISTYAQQFWRFVKSAFSKVFSAFSRNTPAKQPVKTSTSFNPAKPENNENQSPNSSQSRSDNDEAEQLQLEEVLRFSEETNDAETARRQSGNTSSTAPSSTTEDTDFEKQIQERRDAELSPQLAAQERASAAKIANRQGRRSAASEKHATSRQKIAQEAMLVEELQMKEVMRRSIETSNTEAANRQNTSSTTPYKGRRVSWASPLQVGPLSTEDLFGEDLKSIHLIQKNSNTCNLLVALNSIFQHPQGQKILDLIKISRIQNGYEVNFPGQRQLITVLDIELVQYGRSKAPGVYILEQAYLNIDPKPPVFDTTHNALVKMLGENHVLSEESIGNALTEMFGEEDVKSNNVSVGDLLSAPDSFVSILTGLNKTPTGHDPYYYSIIPDPTQPDQFNVFNFFDSSQDRLSFLNRDQLNQQFSVEDNLIRLDPPLKN